MVAGSIDSVQRENHRIRIDPEVQKSSSASGNSNIVMAIVLGSAFELALTVAKGEKFATFVVDLDLMGSTCHD